MSFNKMKVHFCDGLFMELPKFKLDSPHRFVTRFYDKAGPGGEPAEMRGR